MGAGEGKTEVCGQVPEAEKREKMAPNGGFCTLGAVSGFKKLVLIQSVL